MIFSFLDEDNIFKRYQDSKIYTEVLTRPFPEFERIARNRPHENIDPAYPKTTDGTTASIIRKTPRRIIQQLPTGTVISEDDGWLGVVAEFIFTERILPQANEDYSLIQKAWMVIEKGLTFGSCATYTPFINHDGVFSPDLSLPYWGDIFLQKGKKSGYACSYIFMRAWWQKADLEALIDSETKLIAKSKKEKSGYTPTWDVECLKTVLEAKTAKDAQAMTPDEKDRGIEASGIELVTAFQKGVGATFYTFNPASKEIVRTKINKDPRGKIPIDWMYGDVDGANPLGRGVVELIGGLQNLIDSDMQSYQYNRALALAPPLIVYGNMATPKFAPNAVIKARDPNAKVIPLTVDTSALVNYPQLYGLQKSQLLNLVNSPDTSISADVGNPSFSKTSAGVRQQATTVSVDDNYIDKMFETWFQAWSETAINLYFAERMGIEELQLNKVTAARLRAMPSFDQAMISPDNKIRLNYDTETPALKFRVNPSTSKKKDTDQQVQSASNLLDMVMKYPQLNSNFGGPIDIDVLSRRIVANSGIDDPEQVAPELTEQQKQNKEQQKQTPNPFSPMFDKPSLRINFPDLPPAAQIQALDSAGIHIKMEDIMQGPVLDPNMRGVMQAPSDPNVLMPGGQQGQSASTTQPIDIMDIYKATTDPTIKAQIEAMAGLAPSANHVQNQVDTNAVTSMASHMKGITDTNNMMNPQETAKENSTETPQQETPQENQQEQMPQESAQAEAQEPTGQAGIAEEMKTLSPLDQQLIQHLQALNIPEQLIQQAIEMAESGATPEQILQAIGVGQ